MANRVIELAIEALDIVRDTAVWDGFVDVTLTVMGTDPSASVVNAWGQTHDVPNLYIFDGSIWPTSSGMNPTATIAALALRCAEHLVENRRLQKVPA